MDHPRNYVSDAIYALDNMLRWEGTDWLDITDEELQLLKSARTYCKIAAARLDAYIKLTNHIGGIEYHEP